jgi:putative addiction module component (TIGR02574 family)
MQMSTFQEVLTAARELDADERLLLVTTIRKELTEADCPASDPELLAELDRRIKNFQDGKTKGTTFEELLARAKKSVEIH